MKQAIVLIIVFGAAFAVTLLLGRELLQKPSLSERPEGGDLRDDPGGLAARRKAEIERTMIPKDMKDVVRELPADESSKTALSKGSIEGTVKTDDGLEPRGLMVTVFPAGPQPKLFGATKFQLTDLEPGSWYLGVSAEGYLPKQAVEAKVQAGKAYDATIWLERGFELRGRVVDDVEQRPIAGVRIDFNGLTWATSDTGGNFRTPIASEKALEIITLTHDEYDKNVMIHPVIPEHEGIQLAMSRGKATLDGRVIPPPGLDRTSYRVRLFAAQGVQEVRRERVFKDWAFEIKGVFSGPGILEVSFPDAGLASRRVNFDAGREAFVRVDVDFSRGGVIDGVYDSPTGIVANIPIQLVDDQGRLAGEMRTDAKGRFRFASAADGDYAIRMDARIPPLYTESFHVTEGKTSSITVDGTTGRLR